MRKSSLFNHLTSFSPETATRSVIPNDRVTVTETKAPSQTDTINAPRAMLEGLNALIEEARCRGAEQAQEKLQLRQREEELEREKIYAMRLTAERALWLRETIEPLQQNWRDSLDLLGRELAVVVAEALSSFIEESQRHRIVDAFVSEVKDVFNDGVSSSIKLHGPADVLSMAGAALRRSGLRVETVVRDEPEIRARIDRTIVRARLDAWVCELAMSEGAIRHG